MKKAILLFACALISVTCMAQSRAKRERAAMDSIKKYAAEAKVARLKDDSITKAHPVYKGDPNRIYIVQLPEQAIQALLTTSELGVFPYAKELKVTADKLETFGASLSQLRSVVYSQYKRQFLIDSLRSVDPVKFKSDSLAYFKKPKK